MAAASFFFFGAKKLPKNPEFPPSITASNDGLWARGGIADAGRGLPVFGSTWTGLVALWRSLTIAIAFYRGQLSVTAVSGGWKRGKWSHVTRESDRRYVLCGRSRSLDVQC